MRDPPPLLPDTRGERIRSSILCPFLMLPRHLLVRTANRGIHRPLEGAIPATTFSPPGVPRKGSHPTDPRGPLHPGYLAMPQVSTPGMIRPAPHHQPTIIRPRTILPVPTLTSLPTLISRLPCSTLTSPTSPRRHRLNRFPTLKHPPV